jgi:hypothetical protein
MDNLSDINYQFNDEFYKIYIRYDDIINLDIIHYMYHLCIELASHK